MNKARLILAVASIAVLTVSVSACSLGEVGGSGGPDAAPPPPA